MAYYFTIRNKNEYKSINLTNHPSFERTSKFQGDRFSLDEIDKFTSNYANELALRESLYFYGLLDEEEAFKEISIRMKSKGELSKVKYSPVYEDSAKYLDTEYLSYKLKSFSKDFNFLNKFLTYYRNSSVNNDIVCAIRSYTLGNSELDIYILIDEFINRELYNRRYNIEKHCYDYISIKYKSLHDLAMFIYNYENSSEMSKSEINDELNNFINYLKQDTIINKPKVKTRKKILEGQTSFFD